MARRTRVLAHGGGDRRPTGRVRAGRLLAAVLLALAVFLAGRLTAGGQRASHAAAGVSPGPGRVVDGVPVGYERSARGAVAALLAYAPLLGDPRVLLDPARRAQVLRVVGTGRYAQSFRGAGARALVAAGRAPIGVGLGRGVRTLFLATPIAYRVLRYDPQVVVVEGWGVSVVANDLGVRAQATWATTVTTVRWQHENWRIDRVRSEEGPTPVLAAGSGPSSAGEFLARLTGLRGLHHAP